MSHGEPIRKLHGQNMCRCSSSVSQHGNLPHQLWVRRVMAVLPSVECEVAEGRRNIGKEGGSQRGEEETEKEKDHSFA